MLQPGGKPRLQWVDAAKCVGILMVIFGHNPINFIYRYYVYSFHMPLFFILAGVTFSVRKDFIGFIRAKFKALMIPYFFFAACVLAHFEIMNVACGRDYDILDEAYHFLIQDHHSMLWFLVALFLSEIAAYIIIRLTDRLFAGSEMSVLACCAVALLVFHRFTVSMGWTNLPWVLDLLPACVAFLVMGVIYARSGVRSDGERSWLYIALVFVISAAATTLNYCLTGGVNMYECRFGSYPLFIMGVLSSTYFLFLFVQRQALPACLLYIGVWSLVYFGFHRLPLEIMLLVYNKLGVAFEPNSLLSVVLSFVNVPVVCLMVYPICRFITRRCPWVIGKF